MKSFFKMFLASTLGVIVGSVLLSIISTIFFVLVLVGLVSTSSGTSVPELKSKSILRLDMSSLPEVVSPMPFAGLFEGVEEPDALSDVVSAIHYAKTAPEVLGIYINVEDISAGLASIDVVRRALEDFKQSGKPVYAYADSYSQKGYYLSSVADRVMLNPQGSVGLVGISSSSLMFASALKKLGVEVDVFKVGTYKGAVEPFVLDKLSDPNREQIQVYIDGLWRSITEGISVARGISVDSLQAFASRGDAVRQSSHFCDFGLIDTLVYRSDVPEFIARHVQVKKAKELEMTNVSTLATLARMAHRDADDRIAVVYAEGEIMDVSPSSWGDNASYINYDLVDQLRSLADKGDVKAVVLRINSPGGSAFLSEQIWHEVRLLREKKPVIASMGDVAASGGYYIASGADEIYAEPNTITGSMGIFGLIPNAAELANRLGLTEDVVKTNSLAELGTWGGPFGVPLRPLSPEAKILIQRNVERGYDTFLSRVSEGRGMTKAKVDSVAQGRVWLASQAVKLGLVDSLGGVDQAIHRAAELAGIDDYSIVYSKRPSPWEQLFSRNKRQGFVARIKYHLLTDEEKRVYDLMHRLAPCVGLQMRLPYEFGLY